VVFANGGLLLYRSQSDVTTLLAAAVKPTQHSERQKDISARIRI
jgi:hypothetical protein